jgi:Fe-S cluster assembly scaffold protein SufB
MMVNKKSKDLKKGPNKELFYEGGQIIVPNGMIFSSPIIISEILSPIIFKNSKNMKNKKKIHIVAKKGSKIHFIDINDSLCRNDILIEVEKDANVTYSSLYDFNSKTFEGDNFFIENILANKVGKVKESGKLNWNDFLFGGKNISIKIATDLIGNNSFAKSTLFLFASNEEKCNVETKINCLSQNSNGQIITSSILDNFAELNHQGNIFIKKNKSGCSGHQNTRVTLIGKNSKCDVIPILDINNNEVECSHGVSIGKLDEEKLFYLESRGISLKDAKKLLIQGEIEPLICSVNDINLEKQIRHCLDLKQNQI